MPTINSDWYAGNATRAYPLDDAATVRDDAGLALPSQILVDCRVRFPLTLGRFAYLSGVTVSPGIVTVILMAADDAAMPSGGAILQPLGAVSLPQPVTPNRHYPIQPMAAGVGGWLVFGRGIEEPYSGRFSLPGQSILLPRAAAAYHPLPITSLGKFGLEPGLDGVVQLLGGTDLAVTSGMRLVGEVEVDAIVLGLVDNLNRNVYAFYSGPCGGRPESNTCTKPALQMINSVSPDCNGNLTIDFSGAQIYPYVDGGGLAVDLALGMADVCLGQDNLPDSDGNLPGDVEGTCPPPFYQPPPGNLPLLSYWPLDETWPGGVAVDWGALGANATDNLGNVVSSTTPPIAAPTNFTNPQGRFFPDSSPPGFPAGQHTYLTAGIQPGHSLTNNFTVAAWVRCVGRITNQPVISHALFLDDGSALGWSLVSDENGMLASVAGTSGRPTDPLISEFTLPINVWAHVASVTTDDTRYLYFNGQKSVHTNNNLPADSTNVETCIGKDFSGFYGYEFNGDLDDIRIYNIALTDAQILDLAQGNDPLAPAAPPGPSEDCPALPYYESFDAGTPPTWLVVFGAFDLEADDSPGEPSGLEQSGPGPLPSGLTGMPPLHRSNRTVSDTGTVPVDQSYAATEESMRNVAIWNCTTYPTTADMTCTTQLKVVAGAQANGGIVWKHYWATRNNVISDIYELAVINPLTNCLEMYIYNGQAIQKVSAWQFGTGVNQAVVGDWYQLVVHSYIPKNASLWLVDFTVTGITQPSFQQLTVNGYVDNWFQPTDVAPCFGLGTINAHCLFSWFQVVDNG